MFYKAYDNMLATFIRNGFYEGIRYDEFSPNMPSRKRQYKRGQSHLKSFHILQRYPGEEGKGRWI